MLFYAPGCPHCEALMSYLGSGYSSYNVSISYVDAVSNSKFFTDYLSYYNVPQSEWGSVPVLFLGSKYCTGDSQCEAFVAANMANLSASGTRLPDVLNHGVAPITAIAITGLAAVDSVNPCAIAVLILLLSTLFMRDPNKRYKLLLAGASFALGIFTLYMVIGILLVAGIKSALLITNLRNFYVYLAFGAFSILFGLLNIKDYFRYGGFGFTMEVPRKWKPKMAGTIDRIMLSKIASVPGAFIAGIAVTLFLLPCITGPYIVAGSLLSGLSFWDSIPWLLYYNFIFVLPMLIITGLVFASFTSIEKASEFREKNIRKLHLLAGVLLIIVGGIMLASAFGLL